MQKSSEKRDDGLTVHGRYLRDARMGESFGAYVKRVNGHAHHQEDPNRATDAWIAVSSDNGKTWMSTDYAAYETWKQLEPSPWSIPHAIELARSVVCLHAMKNQPIMVRVVPIGVDVRDHYVKEFVLQ